MASPLSSTTVQLVNSWCLSPDPISHDMNHFRQYWSLSDTCETLLNSTLAVSIRQNQKLTITERWENWIIEITYILTESLIRRIEFDWIYQTVGRSLIDLFTRLKISIELNQVEDKWMADVDNLAWQNQLSKWQVVMGGKTMLNMAPDGTWAYYYQQHVKPKEKVVVKQNNVGNVH